MRKRVDVDRIVEMVRLHRMGVPDRKAAAMLKMGPNTHRAARAAFVAAGVWNGDPVDLPKADNLRVLLPQAKPPQQASSVERWRPVIAELELRGLNVKTIHDRLRLDQPDFVGTYDAVKRVVAVIREKRPLLPEDVVIPVETDPGQIGQVDFAYVGKVLDPVSATRRKAWVFLMTLGFSRHFFMYVVFDQSVATWIDLHVRAFRYFGGVPRVIVPDNLKAAVIRAAFGADDDAVAQLEYRKLAPGGSAAPAVAPEDLASQDRAARRTYPLRTTLLLGSVATPRPGSAAGGHTRPSPDLAGWSVGGGARSAR